MSQWFGGPGRKSGKTPGGAPDDSASAARRASTGKFGRPPAGNQEPKSGFDQSAGNPQTRAEEPSSLGTNQEYTYGLGLGPGQGDAAAEARFQLSPPPQNPANRPETPPLYQKPTPTYQQPPFDEPAYQQPQYRPTQQPLQPPSEPSEIGYEQNQSPKQKLNKGFSAQRPGGRAAGYEQFDEYGNETGSETGEQESVAEAYGAGPERIEFKKRIVALIIDFLASYILAIGVMLVPYVNSFVSLQLVMCFCLLIRDYTFEGRGIGKNLMGLQVVDEQSGEPASLKQSLMRNIVLVAPYALTQIVSAVLRIVPFPIVNQTISNIVWGVCGLYVLIVFPWEVYRSYSRSDGLRFGDQLAGTIVTESAMDFTKPLPRR